MKKCGKWNGNTENVPNVKPPKYRRGRRKSMLLPIHIYFYPYLVSIKSWYVTYIESPSFLSSGGLLWTLRKIRGVKPPGSMVFPYRQYNTYFPIGQHSFCFPVFPNFVQAFFCQYGKHFILYIWHWCMQHISKPIRFTAIMLCQNRILIRRRCPIFQTVQNSHHAFCSTGNSRYFCRFNGS